MLLQSVLRDYYFLFYLPLSSDNSVFIRVIYNKKRQSEWIKTRNLSNCSLLAKLRSKIVRILKKSEDRNNIRKNQKVRKKSEICSNFTNFPYFSEDLATLHDMYIFFTIDIFDKKKSNESSFAFLYKPYSNAVQRSVCYSKVKYDRFFRNTQVKKLS